MFVKHLIAVVGIVHVCIKTHMFLPFVINHPVFFHKVIHAVVSWFIKAQRELKSISFCLVTYKLAVDSFPSIHGSPSASADLWVGRIWMHAYNIPTGEIRRRVRARLSLSVENRRREGRKCEMHQQCSARNKSVTLVVFVFISLLAHNTSTHLWYDSTFTLLVFPLLLLHIKGQPLLNYPEASNENNRDC